MWYNFVDEKLIAMPPKYITRYIAALCWCVNLAYAKNKRRVLRNKDPTLAVYITLYKEKCMFSTIEFILSSVFSKFTAEGKCV